MRVIDGWQSRPLDDICSLIKDGSHGTHQDVLEGIPFLSAKDVRDGLLQIPEDCRRISIKDYKSIHKSYEIKRGDILLTIVGTIGRSCMVTGAEPSFSIQRSVGVIRSAQIKSEYLYQYIKSDQFQTSLKDATNASAQGGVYLGSLAKCSVLYPKDPAEQSKIAEILSTIDRAIEQTEALIAKQQCIKAGLMQDLLTRGIDKQGNLRSKETHQFKDSSLGRIPVEWDAMTINDLAIHVASGVTPKGGESVYTKEGVLFIRSQNVHFGGLRLEDVAYIPDRIHDLMLRSEIFENDILLNITGASIGRCCRMPRIDGKANVNQHVCAIRLIHSSEADAGLFSLILESHIGQNQIEKFNAGGNREGLNYQQVRSFLIPWPKEEMERKRVYEGIGKLTDTIIITQNRLNKLRSMKAALMQDLLTGKRRVTALLPKPEVVST